MTKHLFLTSSIEIPCISADIRRKIGGSNSLKTVFVMTPAEAGSEAKDLSWLDGEREMYLDHKILDAYQVNYPYIPLNDNQYVEVVGDMYQIIDATSQSHSS